MSESSLSDFTLTLYLKRFKELAKQNIERLSLSKSFFRTHEQATVEDSVKQEEFSKFISSLSTLSKHFKNEIVKGFLDWKKDFAPVVKENLTVEGYRIIEKAAKSLYTHDFHEIRVVKRTMQLKILRSYNEMRYLSFHYVICTVFLGVLYDVNQVLALEVDTWKGLEELCHEYFQNPIVRNTATNYPSKKVVLDHYAKILGLLSQSSVSEVFDNIVAKVNSNVDRGQKEVSVTYLEGIKHISFDFNQDLGLRAAYDFLDAMFKILKWGEKKKKKRYVQSVVESLAIVLSSVTSLDIMESMKNTRRKSATFSFNRASHGKKRPSQRKPTPSLPHPGKGVVVPSQWFDLTSQIYENFVKKKYIKREWSWPFLSAVLCLCSPEYFEEKYWNFLDVTLFKSFGGGHGTKMIILDCVIHITGFMIKLGKQRHGVIHELEVQDKLSKIAQVLLSQGKKKDIVSLNEEVYNVISDYIVMIASTYTEFALDRFVLPCLRSDHVVSENTITGLKTFLALADQSDINRLKEMISEGRRRMDKYPSWVSQLLNRSNRKTIESTDRSNYSHQQESTKLIRSPFARSLSITSMVGFSFTYEGALSKKYDVHTLKTDKVFMFSDELGDALARILDTCFSQFGGYLEINDLGKDQNVVPRDKVGGMKVFVNALSCVSRLFPQRMDSGKLIHNIIRATRHLNKEIRTVASKVCVEILEFQHGLRHHLIELFAHFVMEMDNQANIQPSVEMFVELMERWITILNREGSELFYGQYASPTIFSFANLDRIEGIDQPKSSRKKKKKGKKSKRSSQPQEKEKSGDFTATLLNRHLIDVCGLYCLTNPNYRVRMLGKKAIDTLREFLLVLGRKSLGGLAFTAPLSMGGVKRKTTVFSLLDRQGMEMIREVMRAVHGVEGRLKQLKLPDLDHFILYSTEEEYSLFLTRIGKLLSKVCPETSSLCLKLFNRKIQEQMQHFEITYKDLERISARSKFSERLKLWKNMMSISVALSVKHKKVLSSTSSSSSKSHKETPKDGGNVQATDLFRIVMPYMRCNYEMQRNIVIDTLGRVNERMLDIFFENLKMYEESIRKVKRKNKAEMLILREQLAKLYANLSKTIDQQCLSYEKEVSTPNNSPPKKERKNATSNIPRPTDTASVIKQKFVQSITEQLEFLKRKENMYSPEPFLQNLRYHFFVLVEFFVRKYYYGSCGGAVFQPIRRELREELVLYVIEYTGVGNFSRQRAEKEKRNLMSLKKKNEKEDFEEVYIASTKRNQHQACLAFTSLMLGRLFTQKQLRRMKSWNDKRRKKELEELEAQNTKPGSVTKKKKKKKRPSIISVVEDFQTPMGHDIQKGSFASVQTGPGTAGPPQAGQDESGQGGLKTSHRLREAEMKSAKEMFGGDSGSLSVMIITWVDELIHFADDKFTKRIVERMLESILEGHLYKDMVEFYFLRCFTPQLRISRAYFIGFVRVYKRYDLRKLFYLPELLTLVLYQCVSRSQKCRDFSLSVLPSVVNPFTAQDVSRRFRRLMKKDHFLDDEEDTFLEKDIGKPVYLMSSKLQEFYIRLFDFVSKKMSIEYKVYSVDMIDCLHGIMDYIEKPHQEMMLKSCVDWLRWIELRKLKVIDEDPSDSDETEEEEDGEDETEEEDEDEDVIVGGSSSKKSPKSAKKKKRGKVNHQLRSNRKRRPSKRTKKLETQTALLNKLFGLTSKFGDLFPNEIREIWVTLTSTYVKNIKYIVDFLLTKGMQCDQNDEFQFSILQQIAVYCGMSNIKIIINILISRLQNASANSNRPDIHDELYSRRNSSSTFLSLDGTEPMSPNTVHTHQKLMMSKFMGLTSPSHGWGGKGSGGIIDFVADPTTVRYSDMILILLVELQYKYSRNFRLHFPFLLQHCILRLDHPVDASLLDGSDLLETAKYLLRKFGRLDPRKLVRLPDETEFVGDDEDEDEGEAEGGPVGPAAEDVDHAIDETPWAVGSLYAYDDPDAPDVVEKSQLLLRKAPENPRFREAIEQVLSLFIRTVPDFSQHFGTECLNWTIYSQSYHDIIRSLQVYRIVRSSLNGDVVYTFTYLINKYLEGLFHSTMLRMTQDVFSEILYTLTDLIQRLPPRKSLLYPHLFWVGVGMLQSNVLSVFRSGILFLRAILENMGTFTDSVKYVLLACMPFQNVSTKKHQRSLSSSGHIVGGAMADNSYVSASKRRRRFDHASPTPDLSSEPEFTGVQTVVLKGIVHPETEDECVQMLVKLAESKIPQVLVDSSPSQPAMQVLTVLPYLMVHLIDVEGKNLSSSSGFESIPRKVALGMSKVCESQGYDDIAKCFLRYGNGLYYHTAEKFLLELKDPFSTLLSEFTHHPESEDRMFCFLEKVLSEGTPAHQRAVLVILYSLILSTFNIKKREKLMITIIALIKGPLYEEATRVLDVSIHHETFKESSSSLSSSLTDEETEGENEDDPNLFRKLIFGTPSSSSQGPGSGIFSSGPFPLNFGMDNPSPIREADGSSSPQFTTSQLAKASMGSRPADVEFLNTLMRIQKVGLESLDQRNIPRNYQFNEKFVNRPGDGTRRSVRTITTIIKMNRVNRRNRMIALEKIDLNLKRQLLIHEKFRKEHQQMEEALFRPVPTDSGTDEAENNNNNNISLNNGNGISNLRRSGMKRIRNLKAVFTDEEVKKYSDDFNRHLKSQITVKDKVKLFL